MWCVHNLIAPATSFDEDYMRDNMIMKKTCEPGIKDPVNPKTLFRRVLYAGAKMVFDQDY